MRASTAWLAVMFVCVLGPALRAARGGSQEQYDSIFGEEARKVLATPDKRDDAALADKLLAAATKATDDVPFQALLCEKAHELGLKHADGYAAAEHALRLLSQAAPDRQAECRQKMLDLCELRFKVARPEAKVTAMRKLVTQLVSMGDGDLEAGKPADAAGKYKRAFMLAKQAKSADAADLGTKAERAEAMEAADRQAETLAKTLADKPDPAVGRKLLMLQLVERDDPNKAAALLAGADADESLRSYLPLAARSWMELNETQCLELGRWYEHLAGQAGVLGRARMLQRAVAYFDSCVTLHGKHDATATQAGVSAERVRKLLDKAGGPQLGGFQGPPDGLSAELVPWFKQRDALPAKDQPEAVRKKLSEVNGNAEVLLRGSQVLGERVTSLDLHSNKGLKSIGPLYGMQLRMLELDGTGVSSLRALRGMQLVRLSLDDCPGVSSLEGLEGMPLVEFVASKANLTSLKPLRGAKLKHLVVGLNKKLASLEGIEGMPLEDVDVGCCDDLHSIEPLRGAPLVRLQVGNCPNAVGFDVLAGMPLRELDMTHPQVRDLEALRGLKLVTLDLNYGGCFTDLKPLAGMPLERLDLTAAAITSLLPLRNMPLRYLNVVNCKAVKSLDGIEGLPLVTLRLGGTKFADERTAAALKKRIPTLETVDISK